MHDEEEDGPWEQPPADGVSAVQDVQPQWKQPPTIIRLTYTQALAIVLRMDRLRMNGKKVPPWMLKVEDLLLGHDKHRHSLR